MTPPPPRVTAVVVNWNSGSDLAALVVDLAAQTGVDLAILVVDNGSSDDSVVDARATGVAFGLELAGENLGYTGGNNRAAEIAGPDAHLFVVNPDVGLPDPTAIASLAAALFADDTLAAVAPAIETERGLVEYLDSHIDLARATAEHTQTHVPFPADATPRVAPWIDGAAMLVRAEARRDVGFLDDRFFLFFDEVDWCLRASEKGWRVALCPAVRVRHRRSSSFTGTSKGLYYYWRNLYLLCQIHAPGRAWRWHWARKLARLSVRPVVIRSFNSFSSLHGGLDAVRGRFGAGREDAGRGGRFEAWLRRRLGRRTSPVNRRAQPGEIPPSGTMTS